MAEEDNIGLIRTIYSAFGAGDIKALLENVSANAQWVNYGPETIPYAGDFTGRIKELFQAIGQSTTDGKVIPQKFIAQDESVVAIARYTASVRNTGAQLEEPPASIAL
jgi:ketosteroid isomerase-like protein